MRHLRLSVLFVLLVLLLSVGVSAQAAETTRVYLPMVRGEAAVSLLPVPTIAPDDVVAMRREVIRLVNDYRVANGCPAAAEHPILMSATQEWSDYLVNNGLKLAHSNSVDLEWYKNRGYNFSAQENMGSGHETPQEIVDGWKRSPNHNRTLLSCNLNDPLYVGYIYELGVGYNNRVWTLALGSRLP